MRLSAGMLHDTAVDSVYGGGARVGGVAGLGWVRGELAGLYVAVGNLLGVVVLRERLTTATGVGLVAVVAGVLLVSGSPT
jgi:drug/metabolite transporter (DMT)-like permease